MPTGNSCRDGDYMRQKPVIPHTTITAVTLQEHFQVDRTFDRRRLQTSSRGAISDDRQGCEDNDVLSGSYVLSGNSNILPPTLLS